ncbi:hypothetical protein [Zestomonas carbonaria]|uniref:Lipoprotein n=1 Tax=Zestomonas carbonaria TaxID=2762745 RepID=A0A7U7EM24_9GAMM|nr:hypothetical protein [Pseudomonas carbonaria]CAD5106912.1 hypothetical protein PSEWESI4_01180 [Pseudomonas carbonaria]
MISRLLLVMLCGLGLSACSSYYYDDRYDRHGGYVGQRYHDGAYYSANDKYRRYDNNYRRYDSRYDRRYDRRYDDHRRYYPQRYYRGQDGHLHPYRQYQGKDGPRYYVAPPKNAKSKTQRYRQEYRQEYRRDGRIQSPRYAPQRY